MLVANHDQLKAWVVTEGLTAVKAHELLGRQGTVVPERTLHRYALEVLGVGRSARTTTVRVTDGEPGGELLCGFLHRISYVEAANMRRQPETTVSAGLE